MASNFRIRTSLLVLVPLLASGILIIIQFQTLERVKALLLQDELMRAPRLQLGAKSLSLMEALHPIDWILIFSLVGLILWLVIMELRSHRLSTELEQILASEKTTLIFLGVMAFLISRFYLAPGQLILGDSSSHISRIWAAGESLAVGRWPSWSFFNYGGFPLLQFYGPLFFVVVGSIATIIGNIDWATKTVLFLCHFGSVFPVYWWSRSIGSTRQVALIGAVAYILTFQHTHTVIWTGALPVAMIYLLFPLLLLATERSLSAPSKGRILLLVCVTAAIILCHHGYASAALQMAMIYLGLRWILAGTARPRAAHAFAAALGILGGLLLCSGFIWPILTESSGISQSHGLPLLKPGFPTFEFFKKIFIWRNQWSGWSLTYIGVTMFVFAVAGGSLVWKRARKTKEDYISRIIVLLAIFTLLCAARFGRNINLALLFVAVLSGGVSRLHINKITKRLPLIAITVLLLDLGPTTIQAPYRTDNQFLRKGLQRAAGLLRPHRALVGYASRAGTHYYHWGPNDDTELILPTGYFPQGAPLALNSINAMVDALNTPTGISQSVRMNLLYLWDVSGLILHSRDSFVEPKLEGSQVGASDPPIAWIHPASPLLFSEQAFIATDDTLKNLQGRKLLIQHDRRNPLRRAFLRRTMLWVDRMGINRDANIADEIFVVSAESYLLPHTRWDPASSPTPDITGSQGENRNIESANEHTVSLKQSPVGEAVGTTHYEVDLDHVSIGYRAGRAGYLRLAFSWHPTLRVLLDGKEIKPLCSLLGAIVIPTEAGEHTIDLVPGRMQTRTLSSLLGILMGIIAVMLAWKFSKLSPTSI
jgi:hypothetical protein